MQMSPRMFALATAAAIAVIAQPAIASAEDAALKAAIAGPQRGADHVARDPARHPYESLEFWGVKPKATVIEISPGSGYWTEILAPYAKATGGSYVAGVADLANPKLSDGARKGRADFEAKYADQAKFGPITYVGFGPVSGPLGAPGSADVVITARNVHNWMGQPGMLDKVFKDFHDVLKPGGVLAVEQHRAAEGLNVTETAPTGYVPESWLIHAARRAGFELEARSELNANAKDDRDHPFGVWTLKPTRTSERDGRALTAEERAALDAIG